MKMDKRQEFFRSFCTGIRGPVIFGDDEEIHDSTTGERGSFSRLIERIKNGDKSRAVNIIITRANYKRLLDMAFLLRQLGISEVRMIFPESIRGFEEIFNSAVPDVEEAALFIGDARRFLKDSGINILKNRRAYSYLKPRRMFDGKGATMELDIRKNNSEKEVSIIIITREKKKYLEKTLLSLFRQSYPGENLEIIIVDDGSSDIAKDMLIKSEPVCDLKYIHWPRKYPSNPREPINRAGPARNIGVKFSRGESLIFLDDDIIVKSDFVGQHLRMLKTGSRKLVIGRTVREKERQDVRDAYFKVYKNNFKDFPIPWWLLNAGNFSVRKDDFLKVGGFDEDFVFWGIEDEELGYKLFSEGVEIVLNEKALGMHQTHSSENANPESRDAGLKYNSEIFYKKHLDLHIASRFFDIGAEVPDADRENRFFVPVKITGKCNNRCRYCRKMGTVNEDIKLKNLEALLEKILRDKKHAQITGGEPALYSHIEKALHMIKSKGLKCEMASNGRIFAYRDFCEMIISSGIKDFKISVWGGTPEIYDRETGIKGSFLQAEKGMQNLISSGANISLELKVTPSNYHLLRDIIGHFMASGIKKFSLDIVLKFNDIFSDAGDDFFDSVEAVMKKPGAEVDCITILPSSGIYSKTKNLSAREGVQNSYLRDTRNFYRRLLRLRKLGLLSKFDKLDGKGVLPICFGMPSKDDKVFNLKLCERCEFFFVCKGRMVLLDKGGEKIIFFRDDDVTEITESLRDLVGIFTKNRIPVNLQVVPNKLTGEAKEWLNAKKAETPGLIEINQHGWSHTNRAHEGEPHEFGPSVSFQEQLSDISKGMDVMKAAFSQNFVEVFTPPYHGYDSNTIKALKMLDFKAISKFCDGNEVDIPEISPTVDILRYGKKGAKAKHLGEIYREMMESIRDRTCSGVVLHHEEIDEKTLLFLDYFFGKIRDMGVKAKTFSEILEDPNENNDAHG